MFDFLKKKFSSWLGKAKVKNKTKSSEIQKAKKKEEKSVKKKSEKISKLTKDEKESLEKAEKIILETEKSSPVTSMYEEIEAQEDSQKEGNFFTRLIKKITTSKLEQKDFEELFLELELTLLENNVALEAVDAIKKNLSFALVGQQIKKTEAEARILQALKDSILSLLIEPPNLVQKIKDSSSTFVIIFFGINGTGKTTTVAKLAHLLKKNHITSVLAAGDTFRAASIEQLRTHAERLHLPIVAHQYGSDPAAVAYDAKKYADAHNIKVVLIDTAGRMYTKENLLKEMEKIIRISKPDLKIFVGESITGNDVIEQAKSFNDSIGIDGIILTKADVDEKAGAILSVSHITNKPIYYLGTGQSYDSLVPFKKKYVLKNLVL